MMKLLIILIALSVSHPLLSQPGRGEIRQGNRHFHKEKYETAETAYRQALEDNKLSRIAEFNLGDALYRQKKYEEAGRQFEAAAAGEAVKANSAKAYHNLGNSLLQAGKIDESIEAYKDALRRNPGDLDTKYNLSYAQMMKKKENEKNEKSDKNDKSDKSDKNEKNEKNDQKQEQGEQDKQQQQKQESVKISKEDAKRLLEALANDEKKVQEKVKKEKAKAAKVRTLKDW